MQTPKSVANKAVAAAATSLLTISLLLAAAGPAQAEPYNCSAYPRDSRSTSAICTSGTGTYRARVICLSPISTQYARSGSTVRIGQLSHAVCSNADRAIEARVQIMSR